MNDVFDICYCGEQIKRYGAAPGWRHTATNTKWCYESESGKASEDRCDAAPDPHAVLVGSEMDDE